MVRHLTILGSTGSIGQSTLAICRAHKDEFQVQALSAGKNLKILFEQIEEFQPKVVSVISKEDAESLRSQISTNTEIVFGEEGVEAVATFHTSDLVVSAIVGAAGLKPTMQAIEAGKTIALANKESMIIAGEILSELARAKQVSIIPVDSEHSAIFQCLQGESQKHVNKLILTASGGPFWNKPKEEFPSITKADALKHPNWDMGAKISIDSATMMNKGLEVIEAHFLFAFPVEQIEVLVHPQSIVHSLVEFCDGSVLSQMGTPDMRTPISYALSYPNRLPTDFPKLDLKAIQNLSFFAPDFERFPCLRLAYEAAKGQGSLIAVLNAVNEVAVDSFLKDQISFMDISYIVEACLEKHEKHAIRQIEDVLAADTWARTIAREWVERRAENR